MWNYRVIRNKEAYGLYEVFYNNEGEIAAHAENPDLVGESVEDLLASLALMKMDVLKHLDDPDRVLDMDKIEFKSFDED
tara:strand:- start:157 stop:393 length:237 start_codon:yes stop_codon:yes gene_type:complete